MKLLTLLSVITFGDIKNKQNVLLSKNFMLLESR